MLHCELGDCALGDPPAPPVGTGSQPSSVTTVTIDTAASINVRFTRETVPPGKARVDQ
jgi:hypothetical protein